MVPQSRDALGNGAGVPVALSAGFATFFVLEQFLHWHHCHRAQHMQHRPFGSPILLADGLHNFIGGLVHSGWSHRRRFAGARESG